MSRQKPPSGRIIHDSYAVNVPVEIENAYRRGYVHAASHILHDLRKGLTATDLDLWLHGPLMSWRARTRHAEPGTVIERVECPPRAPRPL